MPNEKTIPVRRRNKRRSSFRPLGLLLGAALVIGGVRLALSGQEPQTPETAPVQVLATVPAADITEPPVTVEPPQALRDLLAKNPETLDFVMAYPGSVPETVDLSADYIPGEIPHFLQWDPRWGYTLYGGTQIEDCVGLSGCGPTALSMVIVGLTGDTRWHPGAVAVWAADHGYATESSGTLWTFMSQGSASFGLTAREVPLWEASMIQALHDGPIICAVGPGDFTDGGHFIVISCYKDGYFQVLDPNSKKKSHGWTYDELSWQINGMWNFYLE